MGQHRNGRSPRRYGDGGGTGYKNPPGLKWVPGQSGNPSGRRRGEPRISLIQELHKALATALEAELPLPDGGSIAMREALIRRLCNDSLQNSKTGMRLFELMIHVEAAASRDHEPDADDLPEEDRAILDERVERMARRGADEIAVEEEP